MYMDITDNMDTTEEIQVMYVADDECFKASNETGYPVYYVILYSMATGYPDDMEE